MTIDDDMLDDDDTLLGSIERYDRRQRAGIRALELRIEELAAENEKLRGEALAAARAGSRALLDGILSGAISKPLTDEEKVKRLREIYHAGMSCEGRGERPMGDDELLAMWGSA